MGRVLPDDSKYPITERFPEQMILRVHSEHGYLGLPVTTTYLEAITPNVFPHGPILLPNGLYQGYTVGQRLGNPIASRRYRPGTRIPGRDGQEFHDVEHWALGSKLHMTAVGRGLLGLRRRSDEDVDFIEDGGRAVAAEEGIVLLWQCNTEEDRRGVVAEQACKLMSGILPPEVQLGPGDYYRALMAGQRVVNYLTTTIGTYSYDSPEIKEAFIEVDFANHAIGPV